jgi:hypothetical protein
MRPKHINFEKWTIQHTERFNKSIFIPNKKDDCWIWISSKQPDGYGRFYFDNRLIQASRISYWLRHGDLDQQKLICHHCDNPCCVNPDHLFLGTYKDNNDDMTKKNRAVYVFGQDVGNSKLKSEDIIKIISLVNSGISRNKVALIFGVSRTQVQRIVLGKNWNSVYLKAQNAMFMTDRLEATHDPA